MYYHCRPLKYVIYGKVFPPPIDISDWMTNCYKWVGRHTGYFPQIWLSRSNSSITGFKSRCLLKKSYVYAKSPGSRSQTKIAKDSVLFGFDIIKGFSINYDHWELIMNSLLDIEDFEKQNKAIVESLNCIVGCYKEDNEPLDGEIKDWVDAGCNLDVFLKKYVFVESNQIVVPSLNLKSAKKIICHNEKQKKKLRKMGFIEDRIEIKNIKTRPW